MSSRFPSPSLASQQAPNPARLTALSAVKLPRWGIFALCLLYILVGLVRRDPWRSADVIGLAQMWSTYGKAWSQWLAPEAAGIAVAQNGPLLAWMGALCMKAFGPLLGNILAGRVPNLIWFALTTSSLWYGAYRLGRRPDAQPLALPFGGQPEPRDYGRMLADTALLLLLATLGLLWRSHETSAEPAMLAFHALAFYALTRMLEQPRQGALLLGAALGGAFLARGLPAVAPLLIALALLAWRSRALRPALPWLAGVSLPLALAIALAWWLPTARAFPYWMNGWWHWTGTVFGPITLDGLSEGARNILWFLWPVGPLALLALWRWRRHLSSPHLQIPVALLLGGGVMLVFTREPDDGEFMALAVPAAMVAALALPTLRRGLVNALDWFALMVFTLSACLMWLGWIAVNTGEPYKIARNISRLTPGFDFHIPALSLAAAVAATLAWIALIVWRLRNQPTGLWRGTVLSAGGVITNWVLIMALWLPALNYNKSYRDVSHGLAQALAHERASGGAAECVRGAGLGLSQRASFAVFDSLRLEFAGDCPLVLLQGSTEVLDKTARQGEYAGARILWEGSRASETRKPPRDREAFMLLRPAP